MATTQTPKGTAMIDIYATDAAKRAALMYAAQPPCTSCGEQGYLRYDPDSDQYLICDICGIEH